MTYCSSFLPQRGFGADTDFKSLVQHNRFLFRVYTPKHHSPIEKDHDLFMIAPKFVEKYNPFPETLSRSPPEPPAYSDVVKYMDWTTRSSSPHISTSFSFAWALWEAMRRYRENVKHDIEIAVIDAASLEERAVTALDLLLLSNPEQEHPDHWRWRRFAEESQCVLVHGYIPESAVFSSIPLITIISHLPSYFLPESRDMNGSRSGYRKFAVDMTNRYHSLSSALRLRDATIGSVQLAISFLRPWFEKEVITEGLRDALDVATELSNRIACWPEEDIEDLIPAIEGLVRSIAEEIIRKHVGCLREEESLRATIFGLEDLLRVYEQHFRNERPVDDQSIMSSPSNTFVHSLSPPPSPTLKIVIPQSPDMDLDMFKTPRSSFPTAPTTPADDDGMAERQLPLLFSDLKLPTVSTGEPEPEPEPERARASNLPFSEPIMISVTGFLFGAFIALCFMSTQRRTLLALS
ncbi:hypothetical protein C8J56DRAFT_441474 [Mycena floridula]|nr:hypothetical protein C8J56DRAFT_441474 [Mycena floridula]